MLNIGFIGAGNMGSSMIQGIIKEAEDCHVVVYDIDNTKINSFNKNKHINIVSSMEEVCKESKYIILAIKPQYYLEVFKQIKEYLTKAHIIITIAPGFPISKTKAYMDIDVRVVRAMPNTPALIGEAMTAYCYEANEITLTENEEIIQLFSSFGKCVQIKESEMEAVIATSGSSPAYAYVFIEAMADAAVSFGLPRDTAYILAAQSLKGAAQMVLETQIHPGELKDAVCSPGGTTIQAVMKLEETQFRNSIMQAMVACYTKAQSMN